MGKVKQPRRRGMFQITKADKAAWQAMPKEQARCERMWIKAMAADAALEKLCLLPSGEFQYDPIGMIIACINNMAKYKTVDDPVWRAGYLAAKTQLAFNRHIRRLSKTHDIPMLLVRQHCNAIDPKAVLGNDAARY